MELTDELKAKIHIWAEGSEDLEKVLLLCNSIGLPSLFCCRGHEDKELYDPYISLKMEPENEELIKYLILNSYLENSEKNFHFSYNSNKENIAISMHFLNFKKLKNQIENYINGLENLEKFIEKNNKLETQKQLKKSRNIYFLNEINNIIIFNIKKNNYMFYIENDLNKIILGILCDLEINEFKKFSWKQEELKEIGMEVANDFEYDNKAGEYHRCIDLVYKVNDFVEIYEFINKNMDKLF